MAQDVIGRGGFTLFRQPQAATESRKIAVPIGLRYSQGAIVNIDRIDRLRIASPCPASWEQMTGDDRARLCELCNLHVYDISRMSRKEAERLITRTEGRLCARLFRRTDGTVISRDCPVGLRALRRRAAKITGAVFATIIGLCATVMGQKPSSGSEPSCHPQVTLKRSGSQSDAGAISGRVIDPLGAAVSGAKVSLTISDSKEPTSPIVSTTDNEGNFAIKGLKPGSYDLKVKATGFKSLNVTNIKLSGKELVSVNASLLLDGTSVTIGIIGASDPIDTQPGMTIFTGNTIRKLPIP